jgi:hypothetical protein
MRCACATNQFMVRPTIAIAALPHRPDPALAEDTRRTPITSGL